MSNNELEEYLKTIEPNFDSHIEKGTIEMSNEYYNLLEERMIRLLNENKQLKDKIDKAIQYFKYQLDNFDFYKDTKAKMLCAMGITLLQEGDKENE